MTWDIEGWEALSFVAGIIMAGLAVMLLATNRQRAQNRWFAALLAVEFVLAVASPSFSVATDPAAAGAAATVFMTALAFLVPVYLGFISTLGTGVSRFLRMPVPRLLPWGLPATALFVLAFDRSLLVGRADPAAPDVWATVGGPLLPVYQAAGVLTYIVGLAAALLYWRGSPPGTAMRKQGAVFALAFGLHDGMMILAIITGSIASAIDSTALAGVAYYAIPLSKLVLASLVTYGILRVQLFDIDLKIKWSLGRGTALTLLTGTFFVISETIEFFLPGEGVVANLAGASVVAILVRPAWRFGARLANRLLPGVVATEEFRHERRLDVYRASLEPVAADGLITDRERRILETMRTNLGISPEDADRIESELLGSAVKT